MVRAYDGSFGEVPLPAEAFTDPGIPPGFAPFGIRALRGVLLVTYAMQDDARHDDVAGPGLGYVDAYSPGGRLLARLASRGKLNSPWGLALAPAGFGPESFRLLVGNFGDGHIVSFGLHGRDGHGRDQQHGPGEQGDDLDDDGFYPRVRERPDRHRRALGALLRQRRGGRPHQHALLHRRPEQGGGWPLRPD